MARFSNRRDVPRNHGRVLLISRVQTPSSQNGPAQSGFPLDCPRIHPGQSNSPATLEVAILLVSHGLEAVSAHYFRAPYRMEPSLTITELLPDALWTTFDIQDSGLELRRQVRWK
jgi:hypothetical protein